MEEMGSGHCENNESDIEKRYSTIMKRSKDGGNKNLARYKKWMITKVRRVYFRSSHPELFCKFTGKRLCPSPATLLKKRLWYRCFPVNSAIFLRILLFFYRTLAVAASAFFTSPSSVHYFLMLQFFTNNSVKNIGIIFFYYVYFVYFSADI